MLLIIIFPSLDPDFGVYVNLFVKKAKQTNGGHVMRFNRQSIDSYIYISIIIDPK